VFKRVDGVQWICGKMVSFNKKKKQRCKCRISIRRGTLFDGSRDEMWRILTIIYLWLKSTPIYPTYLIVFFAYLRSVSICTYLLFTFSDFTPKSITEDLEMPLSTISAWLAYCREILSTFYVEISERLGGPGMVVEIEEFAYVKRRFRGHRDHAGSWMFIGYQHGFGRVFSVVVEER